MAGVVNASLAGRPPLDAGALRAALVVPGGFWRDIRVVAEIGSTNSDLLAEARRGLGEGAVLAAEAQSAGRGRMGRHWVSPPRAALMFSALLRPADVPPASRGWVPLLAGVAVARALQAEAAADAQLKWPNDVQVHGAKLAGILAEQAGDAIVVGVGLNVSASRDELPSGQAMSLWLAGADSPDRQAILIAVLRELERWYLMWTGGPAPGDAAACGLRAAYLSACSTVGQDVRVELPGGDVLAGRATGVDAAGCLLVSAAGSLHAVSAGDVVHVR
jgi:BirA family biotin operon repressor/biotin-[acetyl-CoA-carboxylase] ligase